MFVYLKHCPLGLHSGAAASILPIIARGQLRPHVGELYTSWSWASVLLRSAWILALYVDINEATQYELRGP